MTLTEAQIKHMANRFLGWPFPYDIEPDGGISFTRPNYGPGVKWEPVGTNLLNAEQAEAMVRYLIADLPEST